MLIHFTKALITEIKQSLAKIMPTDAANWKWKFECTGSDYFCFSMISCKLNQQFEDKSW
jgi:hypothetical protein